MRCIKSKNLEVMGNPLALLGKVVISIHDQSKHMVTSISYSFNAELGGIEVWAHIEAVGESLKGRRYSKDRFCNFIMDFSLADDLKISNITLSNHFE